MRFGNFVVVKHNGKIVCGKFGDQGIYLKQMGDANPIPFREVEPLFEIEVHRPFPEYFKVDDFRKFVISTLTDADPVKGPHPAITHCEGCGCDWLDNGLNPVGCPYCKLRAEVEREKVAALVAEAIESIKRPEPSEAERMPWPVINTIDAAGAEIPPKIQPSEDDVLKVAQAIRQQIPDAEPIAIEAAARAALKAMEDGK